MTFSTPVKKLNYSTFVILLFGFLLVAACASKKPLIKTIASSQDEKQKLVVFMDGTSNNERSYTNVFKLFNLTTLQDDPNISSAYLRGVGNGGDFLGIISGKGTKREVSNAYLYLAENYNHDFKEEIYLFGFSRGSYAVRILAGMIYSAGIVNVSHLPEKERMKFVKKIYNAYKGKKTLEERRHDTFLVTDQKVNYEEYKIEFMGLWDTVEALGIPDSKEEYYKPKNGYLDQLCNVKQAAHALSLNDSRSTKFTPVLLNNKYVIEECPQYDLSGNVDEVWFFGAHSDVGGGDHVSPISGISLNWMIDQLNGYELLPEGARVFEEPLGSTNNSSKGMKKLFYGNKNRKLVHLVSSGGYKKEKLRIHETVIERMRYPLQAHEINLISLYGECFTRNNRGGYDYIEGSDCFIIEKSKKD